MGHIITTLDNVIDIDGQHFISRYANSAMALHKDGVMIINGDSQLKLKWRDTTVDGNAISSASDLRDAMLMAFKTIGGGDVSTMVEIRDGYWWTSDDGGATWTNTGTKAEAVNYVPEFTEDYFTI